MNKNLLLVLLLVSLVPACSFRRKNGELAGDSGEYGQEIGSKSGKSNFL